MTNHKIPEETILALKKYFKEEVDRRKKEKEHKIVMEAEYLDYMRYRVNRLSFDTTVSILYDFLDSVKKELGLFLTENEIDKENLILWNLFISRSNNFSEKIRNIKKDIYKDRDNVIKYSSPTYFIKDLIEQFSFSEFDSDDEDLSIFFKQLTLAEKQILNAVTKVISDLSNNLEERKERKKVYNRT